MRIITIKFLIIGLCFCQFDWQDGGIAIRQGVHIEWQRSADMDNSSDFIFAWSDTREGGRDIYAQRITDSGEKEWGENGLTVVAEPGRQEDPILIADGNGGAYIVWVDYKDEPINGDIYAQHILSDGSLGWTSEGIGLATMAGKQVSPNMCSDGQGGAYVIWKDLTVSSYGHIYGTHLSPQGALSPGVGIPILSNESYHNNVSIEKGPSGSAVLVWSDDIISDDANIRTQMIDQSCNTLWSTPEEGGIMLCSESGNQLYPKVTYYDENYSVFVWEDHRDSDEFGDIYAQFLNAQGEEILTSQGIPVCNDPANQIKPRVKSFTGNTLDESAAFIIWEDSRNADNSTDIYTQKINHEGTLSWSNNGISVVSEEGIQDQCRLTADQSGGVFYVWLDERDGAYPETNVYLQHFDNNGNPSFEDNGLAVCSENYYQFGPIVRSKNGNASVLWGDRRTGSIGLYFQIINPSSGIALEQQGKEMFFGIDGNGQTPGLTYLNGESLVYWDDRRFSPFQNLTYGLKLNSEASLLNSQNGVALSQNSYQSNASVVFTGNNLFMGFGQTDGDINQFYSILDSDLNSIVSYTAVDENPQATQEYYTIIRNDLENLIYYVYSDNRDFANNIYVMQFNDSGNPTWDSPIKIVETLVDGFLPSDDNVIGAIPNVSSGGIIVLYNSGNFLGTKINAISINSNGQISDGWGDNGENLCDSDGDQYIESFISISDGILVSFRDNRSNSNDVYVQLISWSGNLLFNSSGINITDIENDQESSYMAINQNDEVLICWEDFRLGTEYDLYCKNIDISSDGNYQISEEIELAGQSNTSGGNQTNPFVFSDSSSFLIVWEDSRNGVYTDIYFQEFNDNEIVLSNGGELLCDADFDQLNPKIGRLSSDSYLIYWDDLRSSGKEFLNNIFAQSYSSSADNLSNDLILVPNKYTINNVYPNPFNPLITIDFTVSEISSVKLSVIDLNGREISQLYEDELTIGDYSIDWTPDSYVSSGIYFVRLSINNEEIISTKKITLLK